MAAAKVWIESQAGPKIGGGLLVPARHEMRMPSYAKRDKRVRIQLDCPFRSDK